MQQNNREEVERAQFSEKSMSERSLATWYSCNFKNNKPKASTSVGISNSFTMFVLKKKCLILGVGFFVFVWDLFPFLSPLLMVGFVCKAKSESVKNLKNVIQYFGFSKLVIMEILKL